MAPTPGPGGAATRQRGRVTAGQRSRLGPLRRRVPGHPRRVPRRRRVRVGTRGLHRGRGRRARRPRPARTSSRSAAVPVSAPAGCAARGGRPVGLDLSWRQLQHSRRLDEPTGLVVPSVIGTATALPFADARSTWCSRASARSSSSPTSTRASRRPRGCCAAAAGFAFSITHPTRWSFPDDPDEPGLTAAQSYWDRTPYVEVDDETGVVSYVEHHRTLSDWVRVLAGTRLRDHRTCSSPSGPRTTTASGAAGHAPGAGSRRAPRSSAPTGADASAPSRWPARGSGRGRSAPRRLVLHAAAGEQEAADDQQQRRGSRNRIGRRS